MLEFLEGSDDSLEGGSDIGEVGDTSTDDEEFSLRVRSSSSHEVDYRRQSKEG